MSLKTQTKTFTEDDLRNLIKEDPTYPLLELVVWIFPTDNTKIKVRWQVSLDDNDDFVFSISEIQEGFEEDKEFYTEIYNKMDPSGLLSMFLKGIPNLQAIAQGYANNFCYLDDMQELS